jgi:hypothetical protein
MAVPCGRNNERFRFELNVLGTLFQNPEPLLRSVVLTSYTRM